MTARPASEGARATTRDTPETRAVFATPYAGSMRDGAQVGTGLRGMHVAATHDGLSSCRFGFDTSDRDRHGNRVRPVQQPHKDRRRGVDIPTATSKMALEWAAEGSPEGLMSGSRARTRERVDSSSRLVQRWRFQRHGRTQRGTMACTARRGRHGSRVDALPCAVPQADRRDHRAMHAERGGCARRVRGNLRSPVGG